MGDNNRSEPRKLWTEAEARAHLDACKAKGLTIAEYARNNGISEWRLRWWKSKLKRAEMLKNSARENQAPKTIVGRAEERREARVVSGRQVEEPSQGFVEVEVASAGGRTRSVPGLELRIRGGYELMLRNGPIVTDRHVQSDNGSKNLDFSIGPGGQNACFGQICY